MMTIDTDKAQKNAVRLVRLLVRVRSLLGKHVIDMEEAELTTEPLYGDTCDVMAEVEAELAKVEREP